MISDPTDPNGPRKRVYTPNNSVFVRLAVRLTTVLESAAFVWRTAKIREYSHASETQHYDRGDGLKGGVGGW